MIHNNNNTQNDIIESHEVFHHIQSVQLRELNIKTYQIIVKNRGII